MPKQIIVLDVIASNDGSMNNIHCVFWLYPSPANQQYYVHSNQSPIFAKASAQEITDYQNGVFTEERVEFWFPANATLNAMKTEMISRYNNRASQFAAEQNGWNRYGTFYDGSTWNQVP